MNRLEMEEKKDRAKIYFDDCYKEAVNLFSELDNVNLKTLVTALNEILPLGTEHYYLVIENLLMKKADVLTRKEALHVIFFIRKFTLDYLEGRHERV